jgi:hypothetical protein
VNDPGAAAKLVCDLIGSRLFAVTEARYWFEGQRDDDAASQDVWDEQVRQHKQGHLRNEQPTVRIQRLV